MADDVPARGLVETYLERRLDLERHFSARLGSQDAARGLVQDIYLKIAHRPVEPIDNPVAYLYRLGANLMLDQLRSERRAKARAMAWSEIHTPVQGVQVAAEEPSAETVVLAREQLQRVLEAVRELPSPVQEAFRLHKLEGRSHAETAAAMGVSRSSVEKYLMTSLKWILARVHR